jgi:hypothetical protein
MHGAYAPRLHTEKLLRPSLLVVLLLIAAIGAAFYGLQRSNVANESTDRRSLRSMPIGNPSTQAESRSELHESVELMTDGDGDESSTATVAPNPAGNPGELESLSPARAKDAQARVIISPSTVHAAPATNVRSRPPASAASRTTPQPSPFRGPTEPCTDSVAALGLCGVTGGR